MTSVDFGNLEALAAAVDAGADRLRSYLDEYEGGITDDGEVVEGVRQRYERALEDISERIYSEYENRSERPPAEAIRYARARQEVEANHPELYQRYHALSASIKKGEVWLRQKRDAISALQTLTKTERFLSGAA
jgi:hypothetical protein